VGDQPEEGVEGWEREPQASQERGLGEATQGTPPSPVRKPNDLIKGDLDRGTPPTPSWGLSAHVRQKADHTRAVDRCAARKERARTDSGPPGDHGASKNNYSVSMVGVRPMIFSWEMAEETSSSAISRRFQQKDVGYWSPGWQALRMSGSYCQFTCLVWVQCEGAISKDEKLAPPSSGDFPGERIRLRNVRKRRHRPLGGPGRPQLPSHTVCHKSHERRGAGVWADTQRAGQTAGPG
jgi:hypothetical protein